MISGGPGAEHEVSLRSGRAIAEALRRRGELVTTCVVSRDGTWRTGTRVGLGPAVAALAAADVVIPALHGEWGEGGVVQGFLETIGVPYAGSGVMASATCMDKDRTKRVLAEAGIATARGRVIRAPVTGALAKDLAADLGLPLFVKPVRGGSSFGVSRVTRAADIARAVTVAAEYCGAVLVEQELRGREIDVAVLELPDGTPAVSPLLEIRSDASEPFFTTRAKYDSDRTRFVIPAPVEPDVRHALEALACRAFAALGCAGLARVDFIVDEVRGPVVNEVNSFPGFTEKSQFPLMWREAGIGFEALVGCLVDTALARAPGATQSRSA